MKTAKDAPRHPCPKGSGERVREMKNTSVPSPIIDPNPDHPKGTHPYFVYPRYRKYLHVPEMRPLSVQIVLLSADRRHWEDIMQMSIYYTFFFLPSEILLWNWIATVRYMIPSPADIDECEPTNDCMQKCSNTAGTYNCSCDKFFKRDPTDWRKCSGKVFFGFSFIGECCIMFVSNVTIQWVSLGL